MRLSILTWQLPLVLDLEFLFVMGGRIAGAWRMERRVFVASALTRSSDWYVRYERKEGFNIIAHK